MKLRLALAAATCLVLPLAAHAQPVTGPYVSLEGGTSILNPVNYKFNNSTENGKFQFRPSYTVDGSVGYGFGDGFRVEIAGDFIRNTLHRADDSLGSIQLYGATKTYGPMVNALYDVNVGLPIFPYFGVGAGYQWTKLNPDLGNGFIRIGGTRGSFAYNLIAGLAYPLPMVPGLSLTLEYKFMQLTASRNFSYGTLGGGGGTIKIGQQSYQSFLAGVRYQLFQPPPPPPPPAPAPVAAPAPAPAKTYLVFFDWDKYNLTPRATTIIAEAASDSKTSNVTTLEVSGYTDTSGTPDYNQGLSQRRAQSVAAQLVSDGVPQSEIEIHAYGETHLLVPTGPGVREPQNRRVEIDLQ